MRILCVEDGSVDIDKLEEEGLKDGGILVYRRGATPPFVIELNRADNLIENLNQIRNNILEYGRMGSIDLFHDLVNGEFNHLVEKIKEGE